MADDVTPETNPQYSAVMDAIEDFTRAASINPVAYSRFISRGSLNHEMQKKLLALEETLDAFRKKIVK